MHRYKGLAKLIHDAVGATTHLVEETNESVAAKTMAVLDRVPPIAGPARMVDGVRKLSARGVYGSIHGINALVSRLGDMGFDAWSDVESDAEIVPMRSDCTTEQPWMEDAVIGALNGVIGDHLHERSNPLDLGMQLREGDRYIEAADVQARRVALFIHGVCVTEWCWSMNAEAYHGDPAVNFGTMLQRDHGYAPLFLRYNTGRHISHNGRQLAELLRGLQCEELVIVGHSMGGLVARSACHYAAAGEHRWTDSLTHVVCLGSPHQGAPLEKAGNVITSVLSRFDVPGTTVPARVLNARSAGIKDLRYGYLLDEDWQGFDPDALMGRAGREAEVIDDVSFAFIAATLTTDPEHPVGQLLGDLMVRTGSAGGPITQHTTFEVGSDPVSGVLHHEIGNHPDVYARMLEVFT